jgi:hypothetical protein
MRIAIILFLILKSSIFFGMVNDTIPKHIVTLTIHNDSLIEKQYVYVNFDDSILADYNKLDSSEVINHTVVFKHTTKNGWNVLFLRFNPSFKNMVFPVFINDKINTSIYIKGTGIQSLYSEILKIDSISGNNKVYEEENKYYKQFNDSFAKAISLIQLQNKSTDKKIYEKEITKYNNYLEDYAYYWIKDHPNSPFSYYLLRYPPFDSFRYNTMIELYKSLSPKAAEDNFQYKLFMNVLNEMNRNKQ